MAREALTQKMAMIMPPTKTCFWMGRRASTHWVKATCLLWRASSPRKLQ
jgi:hypothetical protein